MSPLNVDADLRVSLDLDGRVVETHLTGRGRQLELTVDDPSIFAGRADASSVRKVADEISRRGLVVTVRDQHGRSLIRIGRVRAPWWQRLATRSAHIRVTGGRGVLAAGKGRARSSAGVLPTGGLLPPGTPWPLAPTVMRRPVRRASTTHDPLRGGAPRLVGVAADGVWAPEQPVHWLNREAVTRMGSGADCDIRLPGLAEHHAEVEHTQEDEFVIRAVQGEVRVHGEVVHSAPLHNAARVQLGETVLAFSRDEYADHGRPHGGRLGGEVGRQRAQPRRPSAGAGDAGRPEGW